MIHEDLIVLKSSSLSERVRTDLGDHHDLENRDVGISHSAKTQIKFIKSPSMYVYMCTRVFRYLRAISQKYLR